MEIVIRGLLVQADNILLVYLFLKNAYCLSYTTRLNICISYKDSELFCNELKFIFLN